MNISLEQISKDFIKALKAKDEIRVSVLRMIKSAIKEKEIEMKGAPGSLGQEDLIKVFNNQLKIRQEAIKQYQNAGRDSLLEKEKAEAVIIESYLPAKMSEEDLEKMAEDSIKEAGAVTVKDLGKVMPIAIKKAMGKAQGEEVKNMVLKKLS